MLCASSSSQFAGYRALLVVHASAPLRAEAACDGPPTTSNSLRPTPGLPPSKIIVRAARARKYDACEGHDYHPPFPALLWALIDVGFGGISGER
jgi:hypothetical protein